MFKPLQEKSTQTVKVEIEGKQTEVPEGISVAAAVLGHTDEHDCRCSFVSGERRAPYCFIGICHECLMEIDGKPNQQSCIVQVKEGMKIKKQDVQQGR